MPKVMLHATVLTSPHLHVSIVRRKGRRRTCNFWSYVPKDSRHTKAECTEERVDDRTCRLCEQVGHVARDCPDKPPSKCNNCKKEGKGNTYLLSPNASPSNKNAGHATIDCKDNHSFDMSEVADMGPEDAWATIEVADNEKDLDDLKAVGGPMATCETTTDHDEGYQSIL